MLNTKTIIFFCFQQVPHLPKWEVFQEIKNQVIRFMFKNWGKTKVVCDHFVSLWGPLVRPCPPCKTCCCTVALRKPEAIIPFWLFRRQPQIEPLGFFLLSGRRYEWHPAEKVFASQLVSLTLTDKHIRLTIVTNTPTINTLNPSYFKKYELAVHCARNVITQYDKITSEMQLKCACSVN